MYDQLLLSVLILLIHLAPSPAITLILSGEGPIQATIQLATYSASFPEFGMMISALPMHGAS